MNEIREYFHKIQGRQENEILWCANACKTWWKAETDHIFRIADEVCRNEFLFDLPWDMEQTSEPVIFEGEIDWGYMPGEDPEFIYQMNRNRYWICLGQAYAMSGKDIYADTFVSQLLSWIEKNPITDVTKNTTWRTIEAGIRGEYWIKAMSYFVDSPQVTEEVWEQFEKAMILHGEYLLACEVPFSEKSNWGVLENHGLFMIGAMLKGRERAALYCETAIRRLEHQAEVQILDDGVHWEQSPMYHNEVLKCLLEVLRTGGRYQIQIPAVIREKTRNMSYANLIWARPNHLQPAGGDSDDTDVRDLLTICACEFMDGTLKSGGCEHLDFEGIWDYGKEANESYETLPVTELPGTMHQLSDSGNWFLRSGWGEKEDYLHFRCGSLGGGHGHFDKLHMDLSIGGEDVLIDSGRYTYVPCDIRYRLKEAAAHNVPIVDGKEYTGCIGSWGVENLALPVNRFAVQTGEYTLFQGGHLGYIQDGVFLNRKILAIGTKIYVVMDELFGKGAHTLSQHYHLNPSGHVQLENDLALYQGSLAQVSIQTLPVQGKQAKAELIPCLISKHYNQKEEGKLLRVTVEKEEDQPVVSMITVIHGQTEADGVSKTKAGITVTRERVISPLSKRTLKDSEAEALRIDCGEESYLVVLSHVDTGNDCEYIGSCGYFGLGQVMAANISGSNGQGGELSVIAW